MTHVPHKTTPVKSDLRHGSLQVQARIPCSPSGGAKSSAIGSRMGKGGVYNVRLGNAKNQLMRTDSRAPSVFRRLPFIGGSIEFAEVCQNLFWKLQRLQNRSTVAIFLQNQPVCANALNRLGISQLAPASRRIQQAPHLLHSGNAFSQHEIQRRSAAEKNVVIRLSDP